MQIAKTFPYLSWVLSAISLPSSANGLAPDPKILSLIPHSAQIVAGSGVSESSREHRKLLIFTQENAADLDDFVALSAVDDSKFIQQIFFVSGRQSPAMPIEHSILAIGQFNQARIYKAAIQNGARAQSYRGIAIFAMHPFHRDRRLTADPLWMAVVDSDLAIFGTVPNVREELDRHLDRVPPDSALLQRIARLRSEDEMWCLLPDLKRYEAVRQDLALLDRRFLDSAGNELQVEFGIHYGRRIQLDYEFANPSPGPHPDQSREHSQSNQQNESLFSDSSNRANTGPLRGVISISKAQYEKWLTSLYPISRPQ